MCAMMCIYTHIQYVTWQQFLFNLHYIIEWDFDAEQFYVLASSSSEDGLRSRPRINLSWTTTTTTASKLHTYISQKHNASHDMNGSKCQTSSPCRELGRRTQPLFEVRRWQKKLRPWLWREGVRVRVCVRACACVCVRVCFSPPDGTPPGPSGWSRPAGRRTHSGPPLGSSAGHTTRHRESYSQLHGKSNCTAYNIEIKSQKFIYIINSYTVYINYIN